LSPDRPPPVLSVRERIVLAKLIEALAALLGEDSLDE
jgi:hypothetical protein